MVAEGSNIRLASIVLSICFVLIGRTILIAQPKGVFEPSSYYRPDLSDHLQITFTWKLAGQGQLLMNRGLEALEEWQIESALINFNGVLQIDQSFWPALYYKAICLKKLGRLREAKGAFMNLHQTDAEGEVLIELGEIYLAEGEISKARKCFEEAVKHPSTSAKGLFSLGSLLALQGKTNKAIESFQQGINANPNAPEGYMFVALARIEKDGRVSPASVELFDQVLLVDSMYQPAIFWRAVVQMKVGNNELALSDLNRLIARSPGNPLFHGMRGSILEFLGRYDEAFPDLLKAVRHSHIYSGKYYLDQLNEAYDVSQAASYFNRTVYGLPEPSLSIAKKGFCQLVVGRNKEALESLSQSISMTPIPSLYLLRAVLYEKESRTDSSQSNFRKALKLDNDIYFAHLKRGMYFLRMNYTDSAFYETQEMKRIDPENELTYRLSGVVKSTLGDFSGCASDLTRNLGVDSTNMYLLKLRAHCRLKNNEYKDAFNDLLKYQAEVPDDKSITVSLMESALGAGDTAYVVRMLQPMSRKAPNDCELQLTLAGLLVSIRSYDQSINLTKKILSKLESGTCDNAAVFVFIYKARALYTLGLNYQKKGQFMDALDRYSEAFQYQQDAHILLARCLVLIKLNRVKEAKVDLEILRNANYGPAQPYIQQYLNP